MIDDAEAVTWARTFGVDITQVRRDHMISHILAALPTISGLAEAAFIGGTSLCRTHLDGLRVSEDVDLLVSDIDEAAGALTRALGRLLRREYPDLAVSSSTPVPRGRQIQLAAPEVPPVEIQLIRRQAEDDVLDFKQTPVSLRYSRLPHSVRLLVPTAESFVAMKYAAFRDRQEPRDLFDLVHLTRLGAFGQAAADMLAQLTGAPPMSAELRALPLHTATTWSAQLHHQTSIRTAPDDALRIVNAVVAQLDTLT